jgi:hypothetical protein
MNFISRLKLSSKLAVLIGLPLFALVSISFYTLRKDAQSISSHPMLFALWVAFIVAYIFLAVNFIRKLTKALNVVESNAKNLASGRFHESVDIAGLQETANINEAIKKVEDHLTRQTKFAELIKSRNLETSYELCHDQDHLGRALLDIKENLITIRQEDEQRKWASESFATFVEVLQSAKNLKELSNDVIINLVRSIQASQGALFMLAENTDGDHHLEMQACYAFNRTKHLTQQIAVGDGLIGQVFLEKETVYLKDVPDRFVRITSGLGEANPRHVLIVPLKLNGTAQGIVELASFKEFNKDQIAFVEKIGESIAHTISSFRIAENTKRLLDESQAHAEQMRAQEEELRQNQEELQATQETISRKYDSLFKKLGDLNHQSKFDQLKSITSTKKRNVEYYFDIIRNQILTFSEDRMMIEAVKAFKLAFQNIGKDVSNETIDLMKKSLTIYYEKEFIPKLNDNLDLGSLVNQYMPTELKVVLLQYLYISNNRHPVGKKHLLDDPGDGSDYSRSHALYHPILRNFLEKFGYYDIFLIDAVTGDMLYSVFKEVDFATDLSMGIYKSTNFGKVVKTAIESTDKNFVQLIDFESYDPSYHAPASFIACPIYEGDEKTGILVFQMPINKINQILTGNNNWREDGLGDTGETFIVGSDYKFRSISRELIENPAAHLSSMKKLKYDETIIQQVKKMQTNILLEEVKLESVSKALNGITGTQMERNNLGIALLSSFAPLDIQDVHWIIMSTMKEDEASMQINTLREESSS